MNGLIIVDDLSAVVSAIYKTSVLKNYHKVTYTLCSTSLYKM